MQPRSTYNPVPPWQILYPYVTYGYQVNTELQNPTLDFLLSWFWAASRLCMLETKSNKQTNSQPTTRRGKWGETEREKDVTRVEKSITTAIRHYNHWGGGLLPLLNQNFWRFGFSPSLLTEAHACLVAPLCLTLCDPMNCSLPGSSVHAILQARILERVAISFFRGSSRTEDWTSVSYISCTGRQVLYYLSHQGSPTEASWGRQRLALRSFGHYAIICLCAFMK